jgi:hypothetical protein
MNELVSQPNAVGVKVRLTSKAYSALAFPALILGRRFI